MTAYLILKFVKSINVNGKDIPIRGNGEKLIGFCPVAGTEQDALLWSDGDPTGFVKIDIPESEKT